MRRPSRGAGRVGKTFRKAGRGQEESDFLKEGQDNWQALQDGREGSRVPPAGPGGVGRPSWNAGKGCEALLLGREGSVGPTGGWKGLGGPLVGLGWVRRPTWWDGCGWKSLPESWGDWEGREGLRGPHRGREALGSPPRRPGRSLEALTEDQEGLVGPTEGPGGAEGPSEVGRHSRKGQEWSGVSTGDPGGVGRTFWRDGMVERVRRGRRPSRRARRSREALIKDWEVSGDPPEGPLGVRSPFSVGREGSEGPSYGMVGAGRGREALPEWLRGVGRHSRKPGRGCEVFSESREGSVGQERSGDTRTSRAAKACPVQRMHKLMTSGASDLVTLPVDQKKFLVGVEWLGGLPRGLGRVGRSSWRAGRCQETHQEGCEGSGVVGRLSWRVVRG